MLAGALLLGPSLFVYSAAVTQFAGLAVAQTTTLWNAVKDIAVGDGQTKGVGLFSPCLWNGTSCDRARGSILFGQEVSVTRFPTTVGVAPIQVGTLFNSANSSAANTALVVTITGVANQRTHLYSLSAGCTGGASTTYTITDGATVIDSGTVPANNMLTSQAWSPGLTITTGANLLLTVNACGTGNVGLLNVQADQF